MWQRALGNFHNNSLHEAPVLALLNTADDDVECALADDAYALGDFSDLTAIAHEGKREERLRRRRLAQWCVAQFAAPLQFSSRASRGDWVALAFSNHRIGVDVESAHGQPDEIPWNVLPVSERSLLQALPQHQQYGAFAARWVVREAYVKALGEGFARSPESFFIHFHSDQRVMIDDPEARHLVCRVHFMAEQGVVAAAVEIL